MSAKIIIFLIVFIIMAPVALAYESGQTNQSPIVLPEININFVLDAIKSIFSTTNQLINVPSLSQGIPNIQIGGGEAVNLISSVLQQIYQTVSGFLGPIINQVVGQLLPNILNR